MGIVFEKEKDLEDLLYEEMKNEGYSPITDRGVERVYRQVNTGGYGIIDLLSIEAMLTDRGEVVIVNVYELKNGPITMQAVEQICRYKRAFMRARHNPEGSLFTNCHLEFHLVGNGLNSDRDDMVYVVDAIDDVFLWTFTMHTQEGIRFDSRNDWFSTNEDRSKLSQFDREADEVLEIWRNRPKAPVIKL